MSFVLELYADPDDWDVAARAAAATAAPGYVSVVRGRRRRWGRRRRPNVSFGWRQGQELLSDHADWSEDAFTFSDAGRRDLAATVLALADVLKPGWGVRAYWAGDPLKREEKVTAQELADLVRRSRLERCVIYRVR